jgi:hypothetical protein
VNKELVDPSRGILTRSSDEWMDAFNLLFKEEKTRMEMGKNGREFIEQNYSLSQWAPVIAGHFRSLLYNFKA